VHPGPAANAVGNIMPTSNKPPLVVIIPGNPGDVAFYEKFHRRLTERGHEVVISAHPPLCERAENLLPYAAHHARATERYLRDSQRAPDDVEVVLVGHSVGSYLAYLIVAHGLLPVRRVFMLFPFLMRPSFSGRLILASLAFRPLVRGALAAFRSLPGRTKRWLVDRAGGGEHGEPALAILESEQALACAVMSAVERGEIATRRDSSYLFDHGLFTAPDTFVPMFCPVDRWAPPALAHQLGPLAYHFPRSVTHAFVVDAAQREAVVEALHQFLQGVDLRAAPASARPSNGGVDRKKLTIGAGKLGLSG
jgi:pimeloyl-ACP methyl ester carboxylesterase